MKFSIGPACHINFLVICPQNKRMGIISTFNNREIATAVWFTIAFLWAISISGVRRSIHDLLKVFFTPKIIIPIMVMLLYIVCMILIFEKIGFWDESALKDTVLWTLGSPFALYFSLDRVSQDDNYFKRVILDNLKFVLILEFIVNLYSFSLLAELIIIPIVSVMLLMNAFAELKPEYKQVSKLLNFILGVFGLYLIAFTFREIVLDFKNFASLKNLRDFLLPISFSIALLPFLYIMALFMQYETFFVRIDLANKNSDVAKYAKRRVLVTCHLNLSKLNRVSKKAGYPKANNEKDVLEWFK
ncbi:MAG: hypothetical protein AB1522_04425 [Chloroflexota bacterium]